MAAEQREELKLPDKINTMKPVIKVKNISKTYRTGAVEYKALKGISFEVEPGEMVALMGPSGSGKSTTMHILGILDSADSGTYELNGKVIQKYSDDELAGIRNREIGFVFQAFNLLPRASVFKNVELPLVYRGIKREERGSLVLKALKQVGLADKAANMPSQISGGQTQRVAIARAIVANPTMILADEPTGNLDSKTAMSILKVFQQMNELGKTVIIVTHELEIAQSCGRIINLKDGEISSDKINHKVIKL